MSALKAAAGFLLGAALCCLVYLAVHGALYLAAYHLGFRLVAPASATHEATCTTDAECGCVDDCLGELPLERLTTEA